MSHALNLLHQHGRTPILLSEYEQREEQALSDLMDRLDAINTQETWQQ